MTPPPDDVDPAAPVSIEALTVQASEDTLARRIATVLIGALAILVVVFGGLLAFEDKTLPGELIAIGSASAGSLGTLIALGGRSR